jgi:deoxyadenosine/deoxycytidine kinase
MMSVVAVSGTIGAGKSTLCENLSKSTGWSVIREPVTANPYLEDFYADPERWAFAAQVFMVSHRFQQALSQPRAARSGEGVLLDRCFHEDVVFAEVNHEMGNISDRDFETYLHLYESFCKVVAPPEVMVYLRVPVSVALDRIRQRGRASEQVISEEYLCRLEGAYERYIDGHRTTRGGSGQVSQVVVIDHRVGETALEVSNRTLALLRLRPPTTLHL